MISMTNAKSKSKKETIAKIKVITIVLIGIILFIFILGKVGYMEDHYTKEGTVTNIQNGIVTVKDNQGYFWEFEGSNFKIGDKVELLMSANHTGTFEDDIVENAVLQ